MLRAAVDDSTRKSSTSCHRCLCSVSALNVRLAFEEIVIARVGYHAISFTCCFRLRSLRFTCVRVCALFRSVFGGHCVSLCSRASTSIAQNNWCALRARVSARQNEWRLSIRTCDRRSHSRSSHHAVVRDSFCLAALSAHDQLCLPCLSERVPALCLCLLSR